MRIRPSGSSVVVCERLAMETLVNIRATGVGVFGVTKEVINELPGVGDSSGETGVEVGLMVNVGVGTGVDVGSGAEFEQAIPRPVKAKEPIIKSQINRFLKCKIYFILVVLEGIHVELGLYRL